MRGIKITIIGCGLIGGSIALALRRRKPEWSVACLDLADRLPAILEAVYVSGKKLAKVLVKPVDLEEIYHEITR